MQCQIQCQGCFIMLMYPQGAANVRCSQCQHLTPVAASQAAAPQPAQPARAQLQCSGCNIMLMYPRGAANVQCAVCGVVNSAHQANRVAHLQCQGCRTWLMYAHGARSVRCAVCEAITRTAPDAPAPAQPSGGAGPHPRPAAPPTSAAGPAGGEGGGDAGPAQAAAAPELPAVVVQNPPTLDDDGNEVKDVMLGYKDKEKSAQ